MKNKRGLELVASSSSAYKASSEKFLNWWWLPDQVWWRKKRFWVIPKITSANLCKPIHDIIISPSTILLNLESVEKKGKIIPPFIYEEIVSRDSQKKEDVKYFKCKRREYKKLLTKNKTKQVLSFGKAFAPLYPGTFFRYAKLLLSTRITSSSNTNKHSNILKTNKPFLQRNAFKRHR